MTVTTSTTTALTLDAVSYQVGSHRIIENVSLDVNYGEVLALVGPNGAGKSTALGLLAGDLKPTAGEVSLDDRPLARWEAKELARTRAVLLQANQVAFSFTAQDVIDMGRAPWIGTPQADQDDAAIAQAVAVTDVAHLQQRSFPTLSGGEKARVSLARVLAQRTRIVMLDEPTAALDLRHQEEVLRIAREIARQGQAVIIVLHDLSLAAAYADTIAILHHGKLAACGTPGQGLTAERVQEIYG
ncbi:MAG: heme ABC transporter ATP-binding protein, partial [Yaniella sp.]|nr:heme ABC transporter ATP-binding protein [Yaniella sp.]